LTTEVSQSEAIPGGAINRRHLGQIARRQHSPSLSTDVDFLQFGVEELLVWPGV